jgi:sodium pump decarboxylase gamma subunit
MTEMQTEGLMLMIIGIGVVIGILGILGVFVSLIVRVDEWYDKREHEKLENKKAASEAADSENAKAGIPGKAVTAIGLALHEYHEEQTRQVVVFNVTQQGQTSWRSSGRQSIMASRQNVIFRTKPN